MVSVLKRMGVAIAMPVLLLGCTDLGAVREWSSTSLEATQYNELVATYAETPARLARYDAPAAASAWTEQAALRAEQAEALKTQLDVVADYMGVLATLSSDATVDYSRDTDALVASLRNLDTPISATTLGAVGGLMKTMVNAAAGAWRAGAVERLVEQANAPLQTILASELRAIVAEDFRRDLEIEAQLLDSYFKGLLRAGGGSATANAALQEWYEIRKAENRKRQTAVDTYVSVLDKISAGHQQLYDARGELDSVGLAKKLFRLAKDIRRDIRTLIAA
ncbi:MAG: hypothetical protein CMM50_17715 [Rhodospirillaceae bacterium]|nr:hypothetical protein [Rhodospirillaceae bacterium]